MVSVYKNINITHDCELGIAKQYVGVPRRQGMASISCVGDTSMHTSCDYQESLPKKSCAPLVAN